MVLLVVLMALGQFERLPLGASLRLNIVIFEGPLIWGVVFKVVYRRKGPEFGFAVISRTILFIVFSELVLFSNFLYLLFF